MGLCGSHQSTHRDIRLDYSCTSVDVDLEAQPSRLVADSGTSGESSFFREGFFDHTVNLAATRAPIETLGSTIAVHRLTSISRMRVGGSVLTVLESDRLEGRVLLVAP
jgi:hypothetical protein